MNEKQLEDALRAWPLEELPSGFSASVMAKVKARETGAQVSQQVKLVFRLTWMDYALGMFLSLFPVLGFFTFASLPRKFVLYLKYQWLVLQFPAYETALFAIGIGVAAMIFLIFIFSLRYFIPRRGLQL